MSHTAHALATLTRTPTSRFVVSMWHLPFESVTDAVVVTGYFDSEDAAGAFTRPNQHPPEMACVTPIAAHDDILAKVYADMTRRVERAEKDLDLSGSEEERIYHKRALDAAQASVSRIHQELSTFNPELWADLNAELSPEMS